MSANDQGILAGTVIVNVVIYAFLIIGLRSRRRLPQLRVTTVGEAFRLLERSVKKTFPDLPDGFTWSEAISRARRSDLKKIDWNELEREVKAYEAFRYGGVQVSAFRVREILKLAALLPRGGGVGWRTILGIGSSKK